MALLVGCQTYREVPLDSEAVEQALRSPPEEELVVQASSIKHPILEPVTLDPAGGLSPEEAGVLAVLLNPSLRAARDGRAVARAQVLEAGVLPDPELSYDLEVPSAADTTEAVTGYGLQLSWNLSALISRSARMDAARARLSGVDLGIAWKEWQVAQAARAAVWQIASLERQTVLARQIDARLDTLSSTVRLAVQRGSATALDLSAAVSAASNAHYTLLQLEGRIEAQRERLRVLLGLAPGSPVQIESGLELPAGFEPPADEDLLEGLEERRLDLVAFHRGYESTEARLRAAVLDQFPAIRIGPTVARDVENVVASGLSAVIQLPVFDRNRAPIALEKATRQKLFDEYVARVASARADVDTIAARIRILNRELDGDYEALPELRAIADSYRSALESGRTDASAWLAAWEAETGTEMRILRNEGALAQAIVALELVTGRYRVAGMSHARVSDPVAQGACRSNRRGEGCAPGICQGGRAGGPET